MYETVYLLDFILFSTMTTEFSPKLPGDVINVMVNMMEERDSGMPTSSNFKYDRLVKEHELLKEKLDRTLKELALEKEKKTKGTVAVDESKNEDLVNCKRKKVTSTAESYCM